MASAHGVGQLLGGQRLVELAGAEREADHRAEVADALAQVDDLVQEAAPLRAALWEGVMVGMKPASIFTSSGSRPARLAASRRAWRWARASSMVYGLA